MTEDDEKSSDVREAGRSDSKPPSVPAIDESPAPDLDAEPQLALEILEALQTGDPETFARLIKIHRSWQGPYPPPEIL